VTYLNIGSSKLSATSSSVNNIGHTISNKTFRIISEILNTCHSIQVLYVKREKNQQVLVQGYHKFHLTLKILVRPMELKIIHIKAIHEILDSEGPKFYRYIVTKEIISKLGF
jgi:hypothetical protein